MPTHSLTLLVLNLALHIVDGVRGLHLQSDGLTREGLRRGERESGGERLVRKYVSLHT